MPQKSRVYRHPWASSARSLALLTAPLLLTGLAACSTGGSKLASTSYTGSTASAEPRAREPAQERPGLGTTWGERLDAPLTYTSFERAGAAPWAEVVLHYNDLAGVLAHASYISGRPAPLEVDAGEGALTVALTDPSGRTLPGLTAGGRTLIVGEDGERYRIVIHNATAARFEIVASVDGLDVVDGEPADPGRRGYLIDPHGSLTIDGFRTSQDAVAAFRFGKVSESYAAQTSGDRNVGVVGLAIFAERGNPPTGWTNGELGRRDTADPFPQRGYATPPSR